MTGFADLPVEVVEVILCCLDDPVSVVRAESVSQLWRSVVRNMVRRGRLKKTKRTLRRLKTTESFNESSCIKETRLPVFQAGSALAAAAEKIHQTQMEIIRLKYPSSLARLQASTTVEDSRSPRFALLLSVSRPIILTGLAVFLPFGENIAGKVHISVSVTDHAQGQYGPLGPVLTRKDMEISRAEILKHSEMCIDHTTGARIGTRIDVRIIITIQ